MKEVFSSPCLFLSFPFDISYEPSLGKALHQPSQRGVKQNNQNMESDILRQHSLALNHRLPKKPFKPHKIHWLNLSQRGKTPQKGVSWLQQSTASNGEAKVLEIWGVRSTTSLPLLPGLLWFGMVISVRVSSLVQIDLLKNYLYLIGLCAKKYLEATGWKCKYDVRASRSLYEWLVRLYFMTYQPLRLA